MKNSQQRGPWGHLCDKAGAPQLRPASWLLRHNPLWQWNSNQRRLPAAVTKDSKRLAPYSCHYSSIHALTVKYHYSPTHALAVKTRVSQQHLKALGCENAQPLEHLLLLSRSPFLEKFAIKSSFSACSRTRFTCFASNHFTQQSPNHKCRANVSSTLSVFETT